MKWEGNAGIIAWMTDLPTDPTNKDDDNEERQIERGWNEDLSIPPPPLPFWSFLFSQLTTFLVFSCLIQISLGKRKFII